MECKLPEICVAFEQTSLIQNLRGDSFSASVMLPFLGWGNYLFIVRFWQAGIIISGLLGQIPKATGFFGGFFWSCNLQHQIHIYFSSKANKKKPSNPKMKSCVFVKYIKSSIDAYCMYKIVLWIG